VVVAFPQISNLDEFQCLRNDPGVRLSWARSVAELEGADWIVLPGSKHTGGDLAWLRTQGLFGAIQDHAARGGRVLGICGGLQMLGRKLFDPHRVEGHGGGESDGLKLLPIDTHFGPGKTLRRTHARFGAPDHAWAALAGLGFEGYEIRCGRSEADAGVAVVLHNDQGAPIGWQRGPVLGVYAHGLFESADVVRALFGTEARPLDTVFDGLADFIDARFEPGSPLRLIEGNP
jgi:adenosylcobyric acid synthase